MLDDEIGRLFEYRSTDFVCYHGDCLQWDMNIYFSYLFCLLLYDVYFLSLDAEEK